MPALSDPVSILRRQSEELDPGEVAGMTNTGSAPASAVSVLFRSRGASSPARYSRNPRRCARRPNRSSNGPHTPPAGPAPLDTAHVASSHTPGQVTPLLSGHRHSPGVNKLPIGVEAVPSRSLPRSDLTLRLRAGRGSPKSTVIRFRVTALLLCEVRVEIGARGHRRVPGGHKLLRGLEHAHRIGSARRPG
jgi:hypothetical protein